jgi:hypothetical protein
MRLAIALVSLLASRLLPLVLAVLALSCSSKSAGSASSSGDGGDPNTVTLGSDTYTLQPGDEKFYCYTMTLPKDVVVTGFTPSYGQATHHIVFAQTLALEPDGFSECDVFFKTTWAPLFVGGVGTTPLELPAGSGMALTSGTQILLQLHILNASAAPVTGSTSITMQLAADPTAPYTPAGIYGLDDETINIPAGAVGFQQSMPCTIDKPLNVFAYFGHMHRLGTQISVTRNGQPLIGENWDFDVQPTTATTLTLNPNDQLELTCTYSNTTTNAVTFGESTKNEMCVFVFYYTKYDGLDGCQQL